MSFTPGTHVMTQPYRVPANTVLDLTGVTLKYPDGFSGSEFGLLDVDGVSNVEILGGTFCGGGSTRQGWNEHSHAIRVRSSVNVRIHDNQFFDLSGDGIFISDLNPGQRSLDIVVHHNAFHGDNRNRQGVSVSHATSVHITENTFIGMARPDMPGAIDLEPDHPHQEIAHIFISKNIIRGGPQKPLGGIIMANHIAAAQMHHITIDSNDISGPFSHGIYLLGNPNVVESEVYATNNEISNVDKFVTVEHMTAILSGNSTEGRRCRQKDRRRRRRCERRQGG